MSNNKVDLILHPIRLRILTAVHGGQLTAQQLAKMLPDVPQATLYRQINTLVEGELLSIVEERPVRGTVERVYALSTPDALHLTEADMQNATPAEHIQYFSTFLATVMADFTRYAQAQPKLDLAQDGVGYHTLAVYLSDEEMQAFGARLHELLQHYQAPTEARKRRLFSFVIMPSTQDGDSTA